MSVYVNKQDEFHNYEIHFSYEMEDEDNGETYEYNNSVLVYINDKEIREMEKEIEESSSFYVRERRTRNQNARGHAIKQQVYYTTRWNDFRDDNAEQTVWDYKLKCVLLKDRSN